MANKDEVLSAVQHLVEVFDKHKLGNPFVSGRLREALVARFLGHQLSDGYQGFDARSLPNAHGIGEFYEYKITSGRYLSGRYDIPYRSTWEEQKTYVIEEKLACSQHFFARFDGYELIEVRRMSYDILVELLLPKIRAKYLQDKSQLQNRGLYVTLTDPDIRCHSKSMM